MNRMFAIIEREMRKFFRSPTLMIMSLMMPFLQLIIMGNAFGGKITGLHVAVVDYDHGPQSVKIREAFDSIAVNIKTFTTVDYNDENLAREDVRTGRMDAAVIIPAQYSAAFTRRTLLTLALSSITRTCSPPAQWRARCSWLSTL